MVAIEFLVPGGFENESRLLLERMNARIPTGKVVVFLREKKGPGEAGLVRLVSSQGLWAASSRSAFDTPLTPQAFGDGELSSELTGVGSLDDFIAYVAKVGP